jgi:hypothetical protein
MFFLAGRYMDRLIDYLLFENWQNAWAFPPGPHTTGSAKAASSVCSSVPAVFAFARVTLRRCWNNWRKRPNETFRTASKAKAPSCPENLHVHHQDEVGFG